MRGISRWMESPSKIGILSNSALIWGLFLRKYYCSVAVSGKTLPMPSQMPPRKKLFLQQKKPMHGSLSKSFRRGGTPQEVKEASGSQVVNANEMALHGRFSKIQPSPYWRQR